MLVCPHSLCKIDGYLFILKSSTKSQVTQPKTGQSGPVGMDASICVWDNPAHLSVDIFPVAGCQCDFHPKTGWVGLGTRFGMMQVSSP